jgi:multiple sugar transport system permease protein/putative aldouronate transport system permease protein
MSSNALSFRGKPAKPKLRTPGNGRPVWEEKPTKAGQAAKGLTLGVVVALVAIPIYAVVLTSLSPQSSVNIAGGIVLVPHGLTLNAYREMLSGGVITRAMVVSLAITAVGTAISMVVSVLCAYGLSRPRSLGHRWILMMLIATMFFSGGIIPSFIVVSDIFNGYDQYWALILPGAVSAFNILIMRAFYMNTAGELIDAAKIDGASDFRILWSVILPTSKAVNAVMALFYAVGYWSAFFNVMLYMPADSSKWTLQYVLYTYVSQGATMPGQNQATTFAGKDQPAPLSLQMCVVVLTLIPIMMIYPFVQKHFTKGMLTGAIKG